jgi:DNA-binding protein HU-beta
MKAAKAVTRAEIARDAAKNSGLSSSDIDRALGASLTVIEKALKRGDEVVFSGFGKFSVSQGGRREGRNPATGERIRIAASRVPKFTAGAELRKVVNGGPIKVSGRPVKSSLVDAVAESSGLSSSDVERALDASLTVIEKALKRGDEVVFSGFGKFSVSERGRREGRDPATGERIRIATSRVPKFTAGAGLTRALKSNRLNTATKKAVSTSAKVESPFNDEVQRVHRLAHLTDRTIATAVGASPSTVRDWLAFRSSPSGDRADRVAAFAEIVDRLARVMEPAYIPVWLAKPIAGLDDRRPIDLLAAREVRRVARFISSLEYPVAA